MEVDSTLRRNLGCLATLILWGSTLLPRSEPTKTSPDEKKTEELSVLDARIGKKIKELIKAKEPLGALRIPKEP